MKKYLFTLLIGSLLLSSCSVYKETSSLDGYDFSISPSESSYSSDSSSDTSEDTSEDDNSMFDYSKLTKEELSQYIKLGEYKGLESETYVVEVTDKDVDLYIENILKDDAKLVEVTDRTAKEGDTLTIDYTGYMDGQTFEGGSATDATAVIGAKKFIEGFEEGLIGAKKGEKVTLNLKFPDNYYENLAGKDVVFEVTVKKIECNVLPELTDAYVEEYTDGEIKTIDAFKEDVYNKLYKIKENEKLNLSKEKYWNQVLENSTVLKFPDGVIDEYVESYESYYSQYASMYGVTLEEFLGTTIEEFRENYKKQAEQSHKTQMVLYAAIYEENFNKDISDDEYHKWLNNFAELLGISVEQIAEQYNPESLKNTCIFDLFLDHIYKYRVEVEPDTSSDSSADSSENVSTDSSADASADTSENVSTDSSADVSADIPKDSSDENQIDVSE